jgi:hypothetical protein
VRADDQAVVPVPVDVGRGLPEVVVRPGEAHHAGVLMPRVARCAVDSPVAEPYRTAT